MMPQNENEKMNWVSFSKRMGSKGEAFNVRKLNMKVRQIKNVVSAVMYIIVFIRSLIPKGFLINNLLRYKISTEPTINPKIKELILVVNRARTKSYGSPVAG